MGDGDLSEATETSRLSPALADGEHRAINRRRVGAPATFLSARLAISLVIGGALLIPAASCGGDSGRDVTPLAEAKAEGTTSTTAASSDRETAASTTPEPASDSAAEPPGAGGSSDPTETTVPPTSAPSAERFADGTVVSAGGYEAKTPAVARGLLLEPEWTDEQQEAADVIHEYLDAMITTVTDTKPDTEIPTSMTDLERPDLNAGGLGIQQLHTQNLVRGNTKLSQYLVEPRDSEAAFWVYELSEIADGRFQVAMCQYDDYVATDLETDRVVNDGISSSFWDGQVAPTNAGWRIVVFLKAKAKNGRAGCAAD